MKKYIKIPLIITCSVVITYSLAFSIGFLTDRYSLYFVDNLKGYESRFKPVNELPKIIHNEEYNKVMFDNNDLHKKNLKIFPLSIPYPSYFLRFTQKVKYFNSEIADRAEIYLECNYESSDFINEVDRISKIEDKKNRILYSENLFCLPSFIAQYNDSSKYQYAIINSEQKIIRYVLLIEIGSADYIKFGKDFIPNRRIVDSDLREYAPRGRFSIFE